MSAAVSIDTLATTPDHLLALAEQAIPTPLAAAPEALLVLLDALLEEERIVPEDNFHQELEGMAARSAERAREACLGKAYDWGSTALGGEPDWERYDTVRNLSFETTKKRARDLGRDLVLPKPNELFIDIDTPAQWDTFDRNFDALRRHIKVVSARVRGSPRGGAHRHVVVTLERPVSSIERIAMQACLGSDPMREVLSLARVYTNQEYATAFFEPKDGGEWRTIFRVDTPVAFPFGVALPEPTPPGGEAPR